jgi:hypothetical protein
MIVWQHWLGNTMQIFNQEVQVNNFNLQISINFPVQNSTATTTTTTTHFEKKLWKLQRKGKS